MKKEADNFYPTKKNRKHNIAVYHAHDVLCGRGALINNHVGNYSFRHLVNLNKEKYNSSNLQEKSKIASSLVKAIRNQHPPGRFLKQDEKTSLWNDIGDKKAVEKTRQALREGQSKSRRSSSAEVAIKNLKLQNNLSFTSNVRNEKLYSSCPILSSKIERDHKKNEDKMSDNFFGILPVMTDSNNNFYRRNSNTGSPSIMTRNVNSSLETLNRFSTKKIRGLSTEDLNPNLEHPMTMEGFIHDTRNMKLEIEPNNSIKKETYTKMKLASTSMYNPIFSKEDSLLQTALESSFLKDSIDEKSVVELQSEEINEDEINKLIYQTFVKTGAQDITNSSVEDETKLSLQQKYSDDLNLGGYANRPINTFNSFNVCHQNKMPGNELGNSSKEAHNSSHNRAA